MWNRRALRVGLAALLGVLGSSASCGRRSAGGEPSNVPTASEPQAAVSPAPAEPKTLEDELSLVRDEMARARGLSALERRITAARDPGERQAIAEGVAATFDEVWDDAAPHRSRMLRLCLALEHPAVAPVWIRALGIDGTASAQDNTRLALEGIVRARATEAVPAVIGALEAVMRQPSLDAGERPGETRAAMVDALAELGDRRATPVLLTVLEQPVESQPVGVHRRAATALGRLADPAAVDGLLTVMFTVPDVPSTTGLSERVKTALAEIGEPAVPRVVDVLEGRHVELSRLAQQHGLDSVVMTTMAASFLGAIGSSTAVEPLLKALPTGDCRGRRAAGSDDEDAWKSINTRAVVANALGLLGGERAVEPLCRCATASADPADMFTIAEALGRIGGSRATACLARVVRTGRYSLEAVASPKFEHEIRWEAARFGLLAAGPSDRAVIDKAMKGRQTEEVSRHLESWEPGRAVLRRCGQDPKCFEEVLGDPSEEWFSREIAAMNLSRLSPGDAAVAERIAAAYSVRNPDARVTMAWLAAHTMQGKRCPRCAERMADVMRQEEGSRLPKEYQLAVLMARYSIARLREPTSAAAKERR